MLQRCIHCIKKIIFACVENIRVSPDDYVHSIDEKDCLKHQTAYVWLILVLAVGVRLIICCVQPCQPDEGFVYLLTHNSVPVIMQRLGMDSHPPTHNLLMRPLILRTCNFIVLRLPEALGSVAAAYACFLLGERIRRGCGIWVGALYALSLSVGMNTCQLRAYGFLDCCIWLTIYMCVNIIDYGCPWRRSGRWQWLFFFLTALGAASLHYTGTLVVAVLWTVSAVSAFKHTSQSRFKSLLCLGGALLPVSLWLVYAVFGNNNYMNNVHAFSTNLAELYYVAVYVCGIQFVPNLLIDLHEYIAFDCYSTFVSITWKLLIALVWFFTLRGVCVLYFVNRKLLLTLILPFLALLLSLIISNLRLVQYMQCRHYLPLAPVVFVCLIAGAYPVKLACVSNKLGITLVGFILAANLFQSVSMIWSSPLIAYDFKEINSFVGKHNADKTALIVDGSMLSMAMMVNFGHGAVSFDFSDGSIRYAEGYRGPEVIPLNPFYLHDNYEVLTGKSVFLLMSAFDEIRIGYLRVLNEQFGVIDCKVIKSYWGDMEIYQLQRR